MEAERMAIYMKRKNSATLQKLATKHNIGLKAEKKLNKMENTGLIKIYQDQAASSNNEENISGIYSTLV